MWDLEYVLLIVAALAHFAITAFLIRDLFNFSRRHHKSLWLFFLLAFPFISAYAYRISMKRRRQYFFHW